MSLHDITESLQDAVAASPAWSASVAAETLEDLRHALGDGRIDWDRDAGEAWGRLMVAARPVVALSALVPLALVSGPVDSRVLSVLERSKVVVIASADWERRELKADPETVKRVFRRTEWSAAVDPQGFSASELWWMTV